ncbi:hypothetical protein L1049_011897 [Liquidambar formosana]|uniref:Transposase n=1 Tax=Liquidambar formosana TaxID=63359 RepID=A0AAP0RS63_LIQFO
MDKSWINEDPWTDVYQNGLDKFLQYAYDNASSGGLIYCPCKKCFNSRRYNSEIVKQHLTINGWSKLYSRCKWAYHGEVEILQSQNETLDGEDESEDVDDMCGMLHEAFGIPTAEGGLDERIDEPNPDASKFYNLMEDTEKELYPGCKKFNKLSFLIHSYHVKCLCGLSDKGFTMVLELLKEAFSKGETLPNSFYYIKKIIGELGLGYLLTLKSYVRNRSQPEGSIVEGYHVEEYLTFCTRYLQDVEIKSTRVPRNYEVKEGSDSIIKDLKWLVRGPWQTAKKYKKFVINGFRFRIAAIDKKRNTQNSGVVLTAKATSNEDCTYYGILKDIIELDYYESRKVVLFECDWVQGRDIKVNDFGITLVNSTRFPATKEPFILASQSLQVFYVDDPVEKEWRAAVKILPRDYFDMTKREGSRNDGNTYVESETYIRPELVLQTVGVKNLIEARQDVPVIELSDQPTNENNGDAIEFEESEEEDNHLNSNSALMDCK